MSTKVTGDDVIRMLSLDPHPEGGHYREIYRHAPADGGRGAMGSIYFLLRTGERSHWHRMDTQEIWCHHAGSPLKLAIWAGEGRSVEEYLLGNDLTAGERPQVMIPEGTWQTAQTLGDWTLVGCITAPVFEFAGWELAPRDWSPTEHKDGH